MQKIQYPDLDPTSSAVKIYKSHPISRGQYTEIIKNQLNTDVQQLHNDNNKVVIGYVSHGWARPRFKDYEKHGGLNVQEVIIVYETNSISDATTAEMELIDHFMGNHESNENCQAGYVKNESDQNKFYVYVALQP